MSIFIRAVVAIFVVTISNAVAQDEPISNREFLRPIESEKKSDFRSRNALEIGKVEYFAKKGRFEIYEFDIDVLRLEGQTITISPFNGPPIDIISHGIEPDPNYGWIVGTWKGEIVAQNARQTIPVELGIGTWAIGADGELRPPDPNREITMAALQQESYVVSEESVSRLDEKLVYAISGSIPLPHLRRQIDIVQMDDNLEALILYEVNLDKAIAPVNDSPSFDEESKARVDATEFGREQLRRVEAYNAHVENLKQELGITENAGVITR